METNRSAQPPFFSLAGIAMTDDEAGRYTEEADRVKIDFFGTTDMTFHEPSLRTHKGPYYFNGDVSKQQKLDQEIVDLIEGTEATVFGVGICKEAFPNRIRGIWTRPLSPNRYLCDRDHAAA